MEIFALILLGIIAGIFAGLLGVGGGVVIVPVLVWIFQTYAEIPPTHLMHIAIGTSLSTIVLTSLSSIRAHHQHGAVQWSTVWQLTPGIIIGTLLGALIADALPNTSLQRFFAVFILFISVQFSINIQPASHRQLPGGLAMGAVGWIIGQISALVGIGGGSLTVPFLIGCNVPVRHAIATSAACGFPIAVFGTIGFIATGWHLNNLPTWSSGYIYWPAFFAIAPASWLFAPLGAKLAHTLPVKLLKKIFAVYLAVVGVKMLLA